MWLAFLLIIKLPLVVHKPRGIYHPIQTELAKAPFRPSVYVYHTSTSRIEMCKTLWIVYKSVHGSTWINQSRDILHARSPSSNLNCNVSVKQALGWIVRWKQMLCNHRVKKVGYLVCCRITKIQAFDLSGKNGNHIRLVSCRNQTKRKYVKSK